jgi:hypothetical protein
MELVRRFNLLHQRGIRGQAGLLSNGGAMVKACQEGELTLPCTNLYEVFTYSFYVMWETHLIGGNFEARRVLAVVRNGGNLPVNFDSCSRSRRWSSNVENYSNGCGEYVDDQWRVFMVLVLEMWHGGDGGSARVPRASSWGK